MGLIKNENYICIQGWMINDLNLSGNSLLVYAIIYSFSQDGEGKFTGSLQYLADWCNATKQGVQKNLKELLDRGLISKTSIIKNNQTFCEYACTTYNKVVQPIQQSCNNTIDNIQGNTNNTKVLFTTQPKTSSRKKNLHDKCTDIIQDYTNDVLLRNVLYGYRDMLLEMSNRSGTPLYANVFKGNLNVLSSLADNVDMQIKIVQQSISRGWFHFYAVNDNSRYRDPMNEGGVVTSRRAVDTTDEVPF